MIRNALFLLPLFVAPTVLLAEAPFVRAADASSFAMITIDNPTNVVVHYQLRWGDGEWIDYTLLPGRYTNHYYQLDENGRAPIPQIRFDGVLGDGQVTYLNYKLQFTASYYMGYYQGKVYRFATRGGGCYLDLAAR